MSDYVYTLETIEADVETSSNTIYHGVSYDDTKLKTKSDYLNYRDNAEVYSDINNFGPSKASPKLLDMQSIYQSIDNILSTHKGEREFLPLFGSEIQDMLFEPMDIGTETAIYALIVSAIDLWEPRVKVRTDLTRVTADYDNHKYVIQIAFEVIGLEGEVFGFSRFLDAVGS